MEGDAPASDISRWHIHPWSNVILTDQLEIGVIFKEALKSHQQNRKGECRERDRDEGRDAKREEECEKKMEEQG